MFICRYLIAGLIYNTLVLTVFWLANGREFVEETFFDLGGWLVMLAEIVLWPVFLGASIWVACKEDNS